jgi:hypothetical protein
VKVDPTLAQVGFGSAVLEVGQTSQVPIRFNSTSGIADIQVPVHINAGPLSNLVLQVVAPELDPAFSKLSHTGGTNYLLSLKVRPGQPMQGEKVAAVLAFEIPVTANSAFVPLRMGTVTGHTPDGRLLKDRPGRSGRVVVVGSDPLLEAALAGDGARSLTVYAKPGSSYAVEYAADMKGTGGWNRLPQKLAPIQLATPMQLPNPGFPVVLYRAVKLQTAPLALNP